MPSQTAEKKIREFIEACKSLYRPFVWIDDVIFHRGDVKVTLLVGEDSGGGQIDGRAGLLTLSLRSLIAKRWPKRGRIKTKRAKK